MKIDLMMYVPQQGKLLAVAHVDTVKRLLYKTIKQKHLLTTPPGIAFNCDKLVEAESYGIDFVEVTVRETGDIYSVEYEKFDKLGRVINRFQERQKLLVLRYWNHLTANGDKTIGKAIPTPNPEQMKLAL